jgi:phage portal protein BeeE
MTYSNAVDTRKDLAIHTLRGFIAAIEDRLNMVDISSGSSIIKFDLDDYLREDAKTRMEITTALLTNGIVSIDEAREMEDLAPRGSQDTENQ